MQTSYAKLKAELGDFIPAERLIDDPLRTLAFGTDASFYRLIPKVVVKVADEAELQQILLLANRYSTPVTFRAAGTSLSGQAITDSVLLLLSGEGWRGYEVAPDGGSIKLQPGVIGARANEVLAPFHRKIGPDPASINAAKIGGIAANNASGMCCGTAHNSYNTLISMRVVLADGSVLDTSDPESVKVFKQQHAELLHRLDLLARGTRSNEDLSHRIRHKYRLKNTTGYSLNALIDYRDPVDVLQHLMIGSEGTLGFISNITYRTVPDHPFKTTALILFPDVETACSAVAVLKQSPVTAVELMDRAALRSVQDKPGMPEYLHSLDDEVAALLVDARAEDLEKLHSEVEQIERALVGLEVVRPVEFTFDLAEYQALWNIRKGLFPAVGAVRSTGTTVIIEDVAFPVPELAAAVRELQGLFAKYHYDEALIFGHALEGNLHFVFTQDFGTEQEVARYQGLMDEVCALVVDGYGGSLKAEHGTGRNMAPFVEMEWGSDAYHLMWELKRLFDPDNLLNPGVILNQDPEIHLKHLKPLPAADEIVDKCIECGFCEAVCPSRDLTLTPRQRIVSWREISRLEASGENEPRLMQLLKDYQYQGLESCAVDGLCAIRCPVGIDTGMLTRKIRSQRQHKNGVAAANWINRNYAAVTSVARGGLRLAGMAQDVLGDNLLGRLSGSLRRLSGNRIPQWNPSMPRAAAPMRPESVSVSGYRDKVVYFPTCVNRTMGPAKGDRYQDSLHGCISSLLEKAGYQVIVPEGYQQLCCGLAMESKGYGEQAEKSLHELENALWSASDGGRYPVLCDASPCTYRMVQQMNKPIKVYEPAGFIGKYLMSRLERERQVDSVALHVTCTSRKMGLEKVLFELASLCAKEVVISAEKGCCGFSGDKGFSLPELNASALGHLREEIPDACTMGVSNSRTCEVGLSLHSGISYQSIAYLVDACYQSRE